MNCFWIYFIHSRNINTCAGMMHIKIRTRVEKLTLNDRNFRNTFVSTFCLYFPSLVIIRVIEDKYPHLYKFRRVFSHEANILL